MSSILTNRNNWEEWKSPDRQTTSLPASPTLFEDDLGWETINRPLAAEMLGFRHVIDYAVGYVDNEFTYGSPPTAWVIRDDQAVGLGLRALSIAKRLRQAHGQHQLHVEWDYRGRLKEEGRRIEREKRDHAARNNLIPD